jgi:hypothetical protein
MTQPAAWTNPADDSGWAFVANGNGISGLKVTVDASGTPSLQPVWSSSQTYDDSLGSSPVIANGVLFDARSNLVEARAPATGRQLWQDTSIGPIHWESPIVANGVLYLTDGSAQLTAYGLPSAATATPTSSRVPPTTTATPVPPTATKTLVPATATPTPPASPTQTPTPGAYPTLMFWDGFESGTLSKWNGNAGTGSATVTAAAAHSGAYGLRLSNGAGQFDVLLKALAGPVTASQTTFWVRVNVAAGLERLGQARDLTSTITKWSLLYDPSRQGLWFYAFNGTGSSSTALFTGAHTVPVGTWTQLTVDYAATVTGGAQLLIDGASQPGWAVRGNFSTAAPYQRLQLWNDAVNATDFDDVAIRSR